MLKEEIAPYSKCYFSICTEGNDEENQSGIRFPDRKSKMGPLDMKMDCYPLNHNAESIDNLSADK